MTTYILEDGEERNLQNPITFEIPSLKERMNLSIGDFIKVIFKTDHKKIKCERMWIIITKIIPNGYEGILDNDPQFAKVKCGDTIICEYKHIINFELNEKN